MNSPVSLSDLIRARLLRPGQQLAFRKQERRKATVTSEGTLTFQGHEYATPSKAASAAAGGTSLNGWVCWFVKGEHGWVSLLQLREGFLDR